MDEGKFHGCPICDRYWLECQGEGECAHSPNGYPADVICDDCRKERDQRIAQVQAKAFHKRLMGR